MAHFFESRKNNLNEVWIRLFKTFLGQKCWGIIFTKLEWRNSVSNFINGCNKHLRAFFWNFWYLLICYFVFTKLLAFLTPIPHKTESKINFKRFFFDFWTLLQVYRQLSDIIETFCLCRNINQHHILVSLLVLLK